MNIHEVQVKINPLLGQRAWGVSLGVGSFLTLEFGKPLPLRENQRPHGEWHLWIYYCAWRLEKEDKILSASEDDRYKIEAAVQHLEGLSLQSIELFPPAGDAVFMFEQQIVLRVFAIYSEEYEHWLLYEPDGNVLSVGPGSDWSYQNSRAIPA